MTPTGTMCSKGRVEWSEVVVRSVVLDNCNFQILSHGYSFGSFTASFERTTA